MSTLRYSPVPNCEGAVFYKKITPNPFYYSQVGYSARKIPIYLQIVINLIHGAFLRGVPRVAISAFPPGLREL